MAGATDHQFDDFRPAWRRTISALWSGHSWLVVSVGTLCIAGLLFFEVVLPGYRRPTTRTYASRFGYPSLLRRLGRPLPVETTTAQERGLERAFLGEGTMTSDPVLVPMIPIGRITAVYVQPGQRIRKGDLLAEIDSRKGRLVAEAARLAFETAKAELRRVQIGSVMVLNREQPGKDAIDVDALRKQLTILRDETALKEKLFEQGLVSKDKLLEEQRALVEAERTLESADLSLRMASAGKSQSEQISLNTLQQAVLEWQERLEELNEYKIVAPADGIIDRVFVHVGEYNQNSGAPAVRIAAGLWFEGYFDQIAFGEIVANAPAEVRLAARPSAVFTGRVANINPIVSYGTGGPESSRPIRPLGTAAAEWPVTFRVRIELPGDAIEQLVPGLTGFARIAVKRTGVAVPEAAMISMSAGSGLLFVVHGKDWEVRRAQYGASEGGWLEVLNGVSPGDKVIVAGQQVLEPGDRINESPWHADPPVHR